MNKQAWKWILEVTSDEDLVAIANEANIKVPGFSRRISAGPQFRTIRSKVIQQMLNQLTKILNCMDRAVEHKEELKSYRTMSMAEVRESIEQGADVQEILSALLSSIDPVHQEKGDELYQHLQEHGKLSEISVEISDQKRKQAEATQLQAQQTVAQQEREKQLKKEEKLTDSMKKENAQLKSEKKAWDQERMEFNKTIRELQAQLKQNQSERLLEKFKEQEQRFEQELGVLRRQLEEKQRVIGENKTRIEKLVEQVEHYKFVTAGWEEPQSQELTAQVQTDAGKKQVALIGRSSRTNTDFSRSPFYQIQVVEPERVEQALEEGTLQRFDQVWVLTYEIPLVKQRKIRKEVDKQQLVEFDTFIKLKSYVYSG